MKKIIRSGLIIIALLLFSVGWAAADPSVSLKPTYAQRNFHGRDGAKEKVRIDIILSGADNMLTFGVKIKTDADYFTISEYHINDTAWNYIQKGYYKDFDGDGKQELGLFGASNAPRSGTVVLGWIMVQHAGGLGNTPVQRQVTASLVNAAGGAFKQFVNSSGAILDSGVSFSGASTSVCIPNFYDVEACRGDFNGDHAVNSSDQSRFNAAYGSAYPASTYDSACDFNADGAVDDADKTVFDADFSRTTPCPVCGGHTINVVFDTTEITRGTIVPAPFEGWVGEPAHFSVADGGSYTLTFKPDPNYSVKDVKLDGTSIFTSLTKPTTNNYGGDRAYTLTGVTADHAIEVHFTSCPGDIDGDRVVTATDTLLLRNVFQTHQGGANFNPRADLDQDDYVTSTDLLLLRQRYGASCN
jgi:hypothetical protein